MKSNINERIEQLLGGDEPDRPVPSLCSYAEQFSQWSEQLVGQAERSPGVVEVNQAILQLINKYMSYREYVPRPHRMKVTSTGHTCIWAVFEEAYKRLKVVELRITPPLLFLPESPQAKQMKDVAGIYIAQIDDE